jgi:hypothetical protein
MLRRLTGKMTMQYEPAAKPNKLVLALKEKQHYQKVSLFH